MSSEDRKKMANAIKQARKIKGLSQKNLGRAIGARQATVSRWEAAIDMPTSSNLIGLMEVLGCTREQISGGVVLSDSLENSSLDEGLLIAAIKFTIKAHKNETPENQAIAVAKYYQIACGLEDVTPEIAYGYFLGMLKG